MGKATRWLRSLLGSKKPSSPATKDKKLLSSNSKWIKSSDTTDRTPAGTTWSSDDPSPTPFIESLDANKHAIAVAAATAAVAEAALAAAQAAAEVVRLTSVGGTTRAASSASASVSAAGGTSSGSSDRRRELAAVKIQSAFRAYLARRALRALKGLVKLQALVRGRIVRKQSADMLRRMQAMARIQARACAVRVPNLGSANSQVKTSKFTRVGSTTSKGYDIRQGIYGSKHAEPNLKRGGSKSSINNNINFEKLHLDSTWLERWMEESAWNNHIETFKNCHLDDGKSDKILEIDTWKPRHGHRQCNKNFQAPQYFQGRKEQGQGTTVFDPISGLSAKFSKPNPSISSEEIASLRSLNLPSQEEQLLPWAPDYSPRLHSAASRPGSSSRRGPVTPTRSECSRSLFGDYAAHPSYMGSTESSLAKLRSQSAPRQRMQAEKLTGRKFVNGLWDMETSSEKGSTPHIQFRNKDRLEMPVQGDTIGYRMAYDSRR